MTNRVTHRLIQAQAHAEAQPYDVRLVVWRDGIEVDVQNPKNLAAITKRLSWLDVEDMQINPVMEMIDLCVSEMPKSD